MAVIDITKIVPYKVTASLSDKILLMYGEMGTRKTSVACCFPKHLLLAYDIGYKFINGANAVPLQTWQDFKSVVKQLDKKEAHEMYDTIIIDTVGMAYTACYNYMLTQMGVDNPGDVPFGMGWKKIRIEFETVLRSIVQKGYGLVMLAHSDEVEKEDEKTKETTTIVKIDIDKRPDLIIKTLADIVLYLHKEPWDEDHTTPTVYAYSNLVSVPTKKRCRYFSDRFEFTYENLQKEMIDAVAKLLNKTELTAEDLDRSTTNPYAVEKVDFEKLRANTVAIASALVDKGYDTQVSEVLTNIFKGNRLSELTECQDNIDKLQVALSTLEDLKERARL